MNDIMKDIDPKAGTVPIPYERLDDVLVKLRRAEVSAYEVRGALFDAEHDLRRLKEAHLATPSASQVDLASAEWNMRTELAGADAHLKRLKEAMEALQTAMRGGEA